MKKNNKNLIAAVVVSVMFAAGPLAALAATTPSLGATATFSILASTYTNSVAGTTMNGDLGYTTGPAVVPTVSGTNYGSGAPYSTAGTDEGSLLSALNAENAIPPTCDHIYGSATDLSLLPQPLTPGVYCISGAASIGTGGITLSGAGTFIFRISGALTTVANSAVTITGGASACDVFWTPAQATTLGANSSFAGTDIDDAGISVGSTVTWAGRALAFGGTVSTNVDTITSCSVPPPTPVVPTPAAPITPVAPVASTGGGTGTGGGRIVPLIGVVKVPTPLALPGGAGPVTYNYTVWNVGGQQPLDNITVTDDACGPVTYVSGDLNGNGKIDPHEDWKYTCTATLATTTTNTAIATGYSDDIYHQASIATAMATVVVGAPITPPLINIVKIPSQLTPFSYGGGNVTYTYTVTNPGVVPMNNVAVTDDKCSPVSYVSGDTNGNKLLDPSEAWVYTCAANVPVTTVNSATAVGSANGFTATGYAYATVLVGAPGLPNTGFPPKGNSIPWNVIALIGGGILASISLVVIQKKRRI